MNDESRDLLEQIVEGPSPVNGGRRTDAAARLVERYAKEVESADVPGDAVGSLLRLAGSLIADVAAFSEQLRPGGGALALRHAAEVAGSADPSLDLPVLPGLERLPEPRQEPVEA